MMSRTVSIRLIAVALLIAAADIALAVFKVFGGEYGWLDYAVIALVAVIFLAAALLRGRDRAEEVQAAKSVRNSFLKHKWEQKYRREW